MNDFPLHSDTTLTQRSGLLGKASPGWMSSSLLRHAYWRGWKWSRRFALVFGWSRAVIASKVAILLGCSFGWRERASAGAFFGHTHWHFWVANFFSSKSEIYEAKKKTQETYCYTVPWIRGLLAVFLPPLRGCLCLFYIPYRVCRSI